MAFHPKRLLRVLRNGLLLKIRGRPQLRQKFQEIYRRGIWGKGAAQFDSGHGSHCDSIVTPYVNMVREFIDSTYGGDCTVVDLGCGDFSLGAELSPFVRKYVAVDIVPELIEHHRLGAHSEGVSFLCLDIVNDPLPSGEVCLLRQVLQHLSNDDIAKILAKLEIYENIFVTEHLPLDGFLRKKNSDIISGKDIRLWIGSGVYLDAKPFNVRFGAITTVLEVPGDGVGRDSVQGIIRTVKISRRDPPGDF